MKIIHLIAKLFFYTLIYICSIFVFSTALASTPSTGFRDFSTNFHGFGTAGVVFSDSEKSGFRRILSQTTQARRNSPDTLTDSMVGVQFNTKYKEKVELAAQVLAKKQIDRDLKDFFPMLFIGLRPTPELRIRTGRLPFDIFPISEFRHVGYANLWVRPPTEYYGILPFEYFHGFDLSYQHLIYNGLLRFRIGTGLFDTSTYYEQPETTTELSFHSFWNANITYHYQPWKVRIGYMRAIIDKTNSIFSEEERRTIPIEKEQLNPTLAAFLDEISLEDSSVAHTSLGLFYDQKNWLISGELGDLQHQKLQKLSYITGYISAGYRVANFTPYITFSKIHTNQKKADRQVPSDFPPHLLRSTRFLAFNQETYTVGCRWDFYSNMACKAQWDHHKIDDRGSCLWLRDGSQQRGETVNTFSLTFDFMF